MISKDMLELLFRPASIQRWNDHIRPHTGFSELDKQAHKMVFAYVLARTEEDSGDRAIDLQEIIEGGLFEFLQRSILTDLRPDIFHHLMEHKSRELNLWVLEQLQTSAETVGGGFWQKLNDYLLVPEYSAREKRILKAAHYLATSWEFGIIEHMNQGIYGLEETRRNITGEVEEFYDLPGVQKYVLGQNNRNFMDLVGQLRFQQRWAQTPRVPQTSVLGHMLIVAVLTYLFSVEIGACTRRIYNNYFAGLFHDLPEVLTRDIVSPVKRSVEGLDAIIKDIEKVQFEEKILPLLSREWHDEILYFLEDEFENKVVVDGCLQLCPAKGLDAEYNQDRFNPLDGEMVKACDQLAAYIEASLSIDYGIRAPDLLRGKEQIYARNAGQIVAGLDFKKLYDYFYFG